MNIVAAFAGDPIARESTYADADVLVEREREKRRMEQDLQAALAEGYPTKPTRRPEAVTPPSRPVIAPLDPDAQARQMWDSADYAIGDIAAIQGRTLAEVYAAVSGGER